jgi:ABC-type multidrug transport system permease subunit
MQRWSAFQQLVLARLRQFYREPEALFWVYIFPLLLAIGLGIAFANRKPEAARVDVVRSDYAEALAEQLRGGGLVVEVHDLEDCRRRYITGKTALYIAFNGGEAEFGIDPTRSESQAARYQVEAIIRKWRAPEALATAERTENEPGNRYIDFLIPGLIGLNLMGGGMWGIGFVIVDMRVRKLLKRLLATPMHRGDFLLALFSGRMVMLAPEMLFLMLVGRFGFGVPFRGSILVVALIVLVGALAFSGIGLLAASRTEKTETISGLMQLIMLPMWLLSGVFFSSKKFPDVVQPFIQALPLTQINDALREVMLEGKSLAEVWWRLVILAAYAIVCYLVALRIFRWR